MLKETNTSPSYETRFANMMCGRSRDLWKRVTMPASARWICIGVLASFNLAVFCLSRPIAEMIDWGYHSTIANCLAAAPLFAVCFLAVITSQSLLVRTLTPIAGLFVTSVVSSALAECGHVHRPELWHIQIIASELFLYLVPTCILIYLFAGFVDLSLSSHDEQRMQNRNRLSIAGLMIAVAAFYAAIVWKSEVDCRYEIARLRWVGVELTVTEIRVRNAREVAIYAPILSSLILCGWWAGISRVRCLVLLVFAVALGAVSCSPSSSTPLKGAAGFSLLSAHVSVNVFAAKLLRQRCSGTRGLRLGTRDSGSTPDIGRIDHEDSGSTPDIGRIHHEPN